MHRFPLGDSTRLGLIAFLAQHDAFICARSHFSGPGWTRPPRRTLEERGWHPRLVQADAPMAPCGPTGPGATPSFLECIRCLAFLASGRRC